MNVQLKSVHPAALRRGPGAVKSACGDSHECLRPDATGEALNSKVMVLPATADVANR